MDARIAMCTLGTRGDILPMCALARRLSQRGHRVTLLSNSNWEALARAAGADFIAIADQDPPQDDRDDLEFYVERIVPSFRHSFEAIAGMAGHGRTPLVIYKAGMVGAQCAAERVGLASVRVALQPSAIRSIERPNWPLTRLAQGRLRGFAARALVATLYSLAELTSPYRRHINRFRRDVGLAALSPGATTQVHDDLLIIFCPEWFALPQRDWPQRAVCVGFPFFDAPAADAGLDGFLAAAERPIVFTRGTGTVNVAAFFGRAVEICERLGTPGILLGCHAPSTGFSSSTIYATPFADLSGLLPRARAIVHHGGIGTTAQAIRAGIPQLVLPDRFDQPDNAMRVASIRLGAAVFGRDASPATLSPVIRAMLSDEIISRRLPVAARSVRAADAADIAATRIERLMPSGTH
jgi:UDP:flavonoid glycosyltransferase YjiC (YdhE family)